MRTSGRLAAIALVASACGGSEPTSTVTTGPPTTRGATVIIDETGRSAPAQPSVAITVTSTTSPGTTAPPNSTTDAGSVPASTTGLDTEPSPSTTTSPLVAPIGATLLEKLFDGDPPARVVLLDVDVIEDHRAGFEAFARRHSLVNRFSAVAGDWIVSWTDDGTPRAARIDDTTAARSLPEAHWLAEYDGRAVVLDRGCRDPLDDTIELLSPTELQPVADLPVANDRPTDVDIECVQTNVRGASGLLVYGDAEGNSSLILNSDGVDITGGDYVGASVLSPDGATIVFTDHSNYGPHLTREIVRRDARTGAELGRWILDHDVLPLAYDGTWIVAASYDISFAEQRGVVSIDTRTGTKRFVETTTRVLLPSP